VLISIFKKELEVAKIEVYETSRTRLRALYLGGISPIEIP